TSYTAITTEFDANGNPTASTDVFGNRSTRTYDANHREITTTNPLGHPSTQGWDPVCSLVNGATDPRGQSAPVRFDALCRVPRTDLPLGDFEIFSMVNAGNPSTQYQRRESPGGDASGNTWSQTYTDGLGRAYRTVTRGAVAGQDVIVDRTFN